MRIYLDNCCFNRPFDDQSQFRVRWEAEAKLIIQDGIMAKRYELVWSYMLDFENQDNPFQERKAAIARWSHRAVMDVSASAVVTRKATALLARGIRPKDALHLACAEQAEAVCFITTDDDLIRNMLDYPGLRVLNPAQFVKEQVT